MPSEEYGKRSEWQEWANQLISEDDPLTSNWDDLLTDNVQDLEPKVKVGCRVPHIPETSPKVAATSASSGDNCFGAPRLPRQVLLLPSHGCAGHPSIMRPLWRLSTDLVAVKVFSFSFSFSA
ncbi:hypothetical protein K1719_003991 [Acacia pycnantha]|nr:hypothetical protein K1719_003991 [Acacia pycnantha]